VKTVALATLLRDLSLVDVIHMEIRGAEAEVPEPALNELRAKVGTLVTGTHSKEIGVRLHEIRRL
jgi:hypothetical protein